MNQVEHCEKATLLAISTVQCAWASYTNCDVHTVVILNVTSSKNK